MTGAVVSGDEMFSPETHDPGTDITELSCMVGLLEVQPGRQPLTAPDMANEPPMPRATITYRTMTGTE